MIATGQYFLIMLFVTCKLIQLKSWVQVPEDYPVVNVKTNKQTDNHNNNNNLKTFARVSNENVP